MSTRASTVEGMACGHCAEAVGAGLRAIAGVTRVAVDVESGRIEVSADREVAAAEVRAAVEEAGYALAEPEP
jgi:copper chaperone CopZ